MILVSALLLGLAGVLALPVVSDLLALLLRGAPPDRSNGHGSPVPRILFLVPAHDEELLIARCIRSIQGLRYPPDRVDVLVIADNCVDGTAARARSLGARCLVRTDETRRGKPRALAWALERIDLEAYDGIVILDADSKVDGGYAAALARRAPLRDKVVQGYNDVSNPTESYLTRMAAVFSAARCIVMNGVKERAGLNVPLGNGYCMGAGVLQRFGWQAYSVCEDWELYALLTAGGVRIENQPEARVFSQEARSLDQSGSQRRRWAAGKISVLIDRAPMVLRSRRIGVLQKVDALGELAAPGPVVLLCIALALAATATWTHAPGGAWVTLLAALSLGRIVVYALIALREVAEPVRALAAFLALPAYAVWRIWIQLSAMVTTGRGPWVRTGRHVEAPVEKSTVTRRG